jgi:NAD(P)-dependent dehydrogenase (short-subunit alcohol dehydrogenase family)
LTEGVAAVTGANRGVGREVSRRLAAQGFTVVLTARDPTQGETAAAGLRAGGGKVLACQLDVTDPGSVDRFARMLEGRFGRLDVLVNNAGVVDRRDRRARNADLRVVKATLRTNLLGAWRLCQVAIPLMLRRSYGRIVNVSSRAGSFDEMRPDVPAYRVSKAALNMLTHTLAAELAGTGILVNAATPGWTRTDMGGPDAPRSVEEGADTIVWLATLPAGGPNGGLFRDRQPIPW